MRKLFLVLANILFISGLLHSQQKEGKVIYERTIQMQLRINDNDAISQALPKTRSDKFELKFGNNRSIWQHIDEDDNSDEFSGNGMQIKMVTAGQNDISFYDFAASRSIEQREIFGKNFIVEDSIHALSWKLTGETQTILGHACQKAVAQNIGKRMQMNIDNGKMEKKEVPDTSAYIAWFTSDIPVPAGPEVQGQLPGLILLLDMNNGRTVYKVLEISPQTDLSSVKAPTKGKKVSPQQFSEERNKMMDEMQKNNQSGGANRIFIRNG